MKKAFLLCAAMLSAVVAEGRNIKISVVPTEAKITIDGSYYGDGVVNFAMKKSEGFINVKCECEGYVTLETKIYSTDKRNAISYNLRKDEFFETSTPSGQINRNMTVEVSKELFKVGEDGRIDASTAWKLITQVVLNYFDEIQTTDMVSGYLQTAWKYRNFPESEKTVRTRVTVKQVGLGDNLSYSIKVSCETAPIYMGKLKTEAFRESDRILKDMEPLINEFQSRLGRQ